MNHRKRKQQKNLKKPKKQIYNSFANDPLDAECPYCEQKQKSCSHVNSLSRSWVRSICKKRNEH